jgi:predicted nucleic acid-binding protein
MGKPIIYWDTCVFLALLQDEKRPNNEMDGVNFIASEIQKNHIILITSIATKGEVLQSTLDQDGIEKWSNFFKRRNVREVLTDGKVWNLTNKIRDYYQQQKDIDGLPTITLPDAVHLASAILYGASEFHTFDEFDSRKNPKRRALIPLNGNVAGYSLKICKPPTPAQQNLFP